MISFQEYPFSIALVTMALLLTIAVKKKSKKSQNKSNLPMVPYALPWFGSAFSIKRMGGIIKWAKSTYCGPIFQAYIAGRTYIFVTDPIAARQLLNLNRTDLYSPITELFGKFSGLPPQDNKMLVSACVRFHGMIANSANSGNVTDTIVQGQHQIIQMISSQMKAGWTKSGLYELVGKMTYNVTVAQLFGIPELDTDYHFRGMHTILHDMFIFGATHPLIQKYSHPKAFSAREAIISSIKQHLIKIDRTNENSGISGGLVPSVNTLFKEKGIGIDKRARMMFPILLASLVNLMPTAFWLFYHIIGKPIAKQNIQDEIRKIMQLKDANASKAKVVFTPFINFIAFFLALYTRVFLLHF
jgi:hypothetical protein